MLKTYSDICGTGLLKPFSSDILFWVVGPTVSTTFYIVVIKICNKLRILQFHAEAVKQLTIRINHQWKLFLWIFNIVKLRKQEMEVQNVKSRSKWMHVFKIRTLKYKRRNITSKKVISLKTETLFLQILNFLDHLVFYVVILFYFLPFMSIVSMYYIFFLLVYFLLLPHMVSWSATQQTDSQLTAWLLLGSPLCEITVKQCWACKLSRTIDLHWNWWAQKTVKL